MLFLKEGKKPLLIFFLFSELQIAAGLGAKMDLNTSIRASDRVRQKMGNSAARKVYYAANYAIFLKLI